MILKINKQRAYCPSYAIKRTIGATPKMACIVFCVFRYIKQVFVLLSITLLRLYKTLKIMVLNATKTVHKCIKGIKGEKL
jgi:hypothetical protein